MAATESILVDREGEKGKGERGKRKPFPIGFKPPLLKGRKKKNVF
jgi:hypothetical protein